MINQWNILTSVWPGSLGSLTLMFLKFGWEMSEKILNITKPSWHVSGKIKLLVWPHRWHIKLIYREEIVKEEMCVEYLENHLHDESNEFDIPQLEVRPVSECRDSASAADTSEWNVLCILLCTWMKLLSFTLTLFQQTEETQNIMCGNSGLGRYVVWKITIVWP